MLHVPNRKGTEKNSIGLMAQHTDRSRTGCWRNNYWMPVSSTDVNKSGLVAQLSDTTTKRKITLQQLRYIQTLHIWSLKYDLFLETTVKSAVAVRQINTFETSPGVTRHSKNCLSVKKMPWSRTLQWKSVIMLCHF